MPAPSIDWPAVRAAADFRLPMPRVPIGGRVGERLGSGTGSSLEFQDYRAYTPGDDLRHVDWAAYARSELLAVRLYREEVAPRVDLVLDVSRSMAVTPGKLDAFGQLSALLACACAHTLADSRIVTTGASPPRPLRRPEDIETVLDCAATLSAAEEPHLPLRRRSLRIVVSDFLFPHDPEALIGRLGRDCASLAVIQLTLREEADPSFTGGYRLVDAEDRGEMDLMLDRPALQAYRARFNRLRQGLLTAARRRGARFAHVLAGSPVRQVARELTAAGVLEAA